jgi:hypothetical protein
LGDFKGELYRAWLEDLAQREEEGRLPPMEDSFALLPAAVARSKALGGSEQAIQKMTGEFQTVLDSLRTGFALEDALEALEILSEVYPDTPWITRLTALVNHTLWISRLPPSTQGVRTLFPYARDYDATRSGFMTLLRQKVETPPPKGGPQGPTIPLSAASAIPGDRRVYLRASRSYERMADFYKDPSLASSRAMLLIYSGTAQDRSLALRIGEEAAALEASSGNYVARGNLASLLFLTGTDYPRSQNILDNLESRIFAQTPGSRVMLTDGFPADSRDIHLNYGIILASLGDTQRAKERLTRLETLGSSGSGETLSLRFANTGISPDELVDKWGEPSRIAYSLSSEVWTYGSLGVSVLFISSDSGSKLSLFRIGRLSPVSPLGSLRTGDKISDFENLLGSPLWKTGDSIVYRRGKNTLSVLALGGRVRSVVVSEAP